MCRGSKELGYLTRTLFKYAARSSSVPRSPRLAARRANSRTVLISVDLRVRWATPNLILLQTVHCTARSKVSLPTFDNRSSKPGDVPSVDPAVKLSLKNLKFSRIALGNLQSCRPQSRRIE